MVVGLARAGPEVLGTLAPVLVSPGAPVAPVVAEVAAEMVGSPFAFNARFILRMRRAPSLAETRVLAVEVEQAAAAVVVVVLAPRTSSSRHSLAGEVATGTLTPGGTPDLPEASTEVMALAPEGTVARAKTAPRPVAPLVVREVAVLREVEGLRSMAMRTSPR